MGIGFGFPCCDCGRWGVYFLGQGTSISHFNSKKFLTNGTSGGFFINDQNTFELKKLPDGRYLFLVSGWVAYNLAGGLRQHLVTVGKVFNHDFTNGPGPSPYDIEFRMFEGKHTDELFSDYRFTIRLVFWLHDDFETSNDYHHPTQRLGDHAIIVRRGWVSSSSTFVRSFVSTENVSRVESPSFQTYHSPTIDAGVRYFRLSSSNLFNQQRQPPADLWGNTLTPPNPTRIPPPSGDDSYSPFSDVPPPEPYFGGLVTSRHQIVMADVDMNYVTYDCTIDGVSLGQIVVKEGPGTGLYANVAWGDIARSDCPEYAEFNSTTGQYFAPPPTGGTPSTPMIPSLVNFFQAVDDYSCNFGPVGFIGGPMQVNYKAAITTASPVTGTPVLRLRIGRNLIDWIQARNAPNNWENINYVINPSTMAPLYDSFNGGRIYLNPFVNNVSETVVSTRYRAAAYPTQIAKDGPSITIKLTRTVATRPFAVARNPTYPDFTNSGPLGTDNWRLQRGVSVSIAPSSTLNPGDTVHRHIATGFKFPAGLEVDPSTGIVSGTPGNLGSGTAGICITDTAGNVSEPSLNPIKWVVVN